MKRSRFIEAVQDNGRPMCVHVDSIILVVSTHEGNGCIIHVSGPGDFNCNTPYMEVMSQIRELV